MKCPKCDGKGFEEFEHGLIMVGCDECEGTGEVPEGILTLSENVSIEAKKLASDLGEITGGQIKVDDSSIGTEPDNQPVGSTNPSKPKQHWKRKTKKKARKRPL